MQNVLKYQNIRFVLLLITPFLYAILGTGCTSEERPALGIPAYTASKPMEIKLPLELDEISGVTYYEHDTSIFAINDERGWLYKISLNQTNNIHKWKFFDGADFEDIVLLDSTFYVLESTGNIIAFRHYTSDSVVAKKNLFPERQGNEFEIIYFDKKVNKIILICKDCESDKKKFLSTYAFDPYTEQYSMHTLKIDVKSIAALMSEKKMKFKPSAATLHPITGELYIISAVNDLLVVVDDSGTAKAAYPIDPAMFKQPEGMTFSNSGDMIISNESAGIGVANILIFRYSQKNGITK